MWCRQCQQDVPAVVSTRGDQQLCCPRCATAIESSTEPVNFEPDWSVEDFEIESDLQELESMTRRFDDQAASRNGRSVQRRIDRPATGVETTTALQSSGTWRTVAAWALLLPGTTALVAGSTLAAWALYSNEGQFWRLGMPIAILGQVLVIFGVVLNFNKRPSNELSELRELLEQTRRPEPSHVPPPHQLVSRLMHTKVDSFDA